LTTPALGGIGVALARMAMAGRLGVEADLSAAPGAEGCSAPEMLFSESNSRFVMSCAPEAREQVEKLLADVPFACVGKVIAEPELRLRLPGGVTVNAQVAELLARYKGTLDRI